MNELDNLSEAERELIVDFIDKSYHPNKQPTVFENGADITEVWKNFERIMSLVSEDIDQIALRMMTLDRIGNAIISRSASIKEPSKQLPSDAIVTPEKLNRLLVSDEVTQYFLLAGGMIEQFTIELVIQGIVSDDRRSDSQRRRIQRMSQSEREWLLYISGEINNEQKGKIRRAYGIRNSLVHDPSGDTIIDELEHVDSDIERTQNVLELLHEKLYGITVDQRFSNLLIEDQ